MAHPPCHWRLQETHQADRRAVRRPVLQVETPTVPHSSRDAPVSVLLLLPQPPSSPPPPQPPRHPQSQRQSQSARVRHAPDEERTHRGGGSQTELLNRRSGERARPDQGRDLPTMSRASTPVTWVRSVVKKKPSLRQATASPRRSNCPMAPSGGAPPPRAFRRPQP